MQRIVFSLDEITAASKLFRAASQVPAQGTALITLQPELAELELTVSNLRRLEPVPEEQQLFISGPANYTVYNVWLAGSRVEPLYLGSLNAPLFGQGRFFYTFDPRNVNNSGYTLTSCKWLLVTASPGARYNLWSGDAAAGVIYGFIPPAQDGAAKVEPPVSLFEKCKKPGMDDDSEVDLDLFDEDEDAAEEAPPKKVYKKRGRRKKAPTESGSPRDGYDDDDDDDDLDP